jgi:hypothetical protein
MKASELRIGNWIYHLGVIQKMTAKGLYQMEGENPFIEPIPLTEEWLIKFGFKKVYYGWEKGSFEVESRGDIYLYSINCNEYTDGMPFKYVHQLQNLYFALTGEELTIKDS